MAYIVEQFVGDNGVQLGYEDMIRPFSFGTNWQKIRVGILCAINGSVTLPSIFPSLGICTGNNALLSNTCTDALYHRFSYAAASVILSGTPPNTYFALGGGTSTNAPIQRVGSGSVNTSPALTGFYSQISANPTLIRSGFFFTVTKGTVGAAAVDIQFIFPGGAGVAGATDISRGTFLAQMESETTILSPWTQYNSTATNLPTRFVKDWNSMFVNWQRVTPTMVVYCMTVVRFL